MNKIVPGAVLLAAVLVPSLARATAPDVPVAFAERRLTLPKGTLRIDDGPYWPLPRGLLEMTRFRFNDRTSTRWHFNAGLGYGITPELELGAHVLRGDLDRERLDDPSVYVIYRFLKDDIELGVYGEATVPFVDPITVTAGMPVAFHLGTAARIDTGPFMQFVRARPRHEDLIVPVMVPINVTRQVYLGPEAAFILRDLDQDDFSLGFFAGYTIESGGGPLADVGGRLRFPSTNADFRILQIMLEAALYFG